MIGASSSRLRFQEPQLLLGRARQSSARSRRRVEIPRDRAVTPDTAPPHHRRARRACLGFVDSGHASKLERILQAAPPDQRHCARRVRASLITLRQRSRADLRGDRQFELIKWGNGHAQLREAGVRQPARRSSRSPRASDLSTWKNLVRTPEKRGRSSFFPPQISRISCDPGLWLDEAPIITGASTAQLAYAAAVEPPTAPTPQPIDVLTAVAASPASCRRN